MAAQYAKFRELGTEILGISTDSVFAHKVFAETSPSGRMVQYPLLSDSTREISECYGALNPETGFATRTTVLISPTGQVKYFSKYPGDVGRNVDELIRVIEALQFNEQTGLSAPAGWTPSKPGLEKDWNQVGKI